MRRTEHIPRPAIGRLSLYLRQMEAFLEARRETVSSRELGAALQLSDAQVRKDLAYFGQFGHRGIGYRVADVIERLRRIMGTNRRSNVVLVGLGNLGHALVSFRGFARKGFEIVAVFDNDPSKVGSEARGGLSVKVQSLAELAATVRRQHVRLGIIAVPAESAQGVADALVAAGVRGILNFAPVSLQVNEKVAVSSVDLAVHLEQLSFQLMTPSR
jgi:redox-sensing transcriptional repressor